MTFLVSSLLFALPINDPVGIVAGSQGSQTPGTREKTCFFKDASRKDASASLEIFGRHLSTRTSLASLRDALSRHGVFSLFQGCRFAQPLATSFDPCGIGCKGMLEVTTP